MAASLYKRLGSSWNLAPCRSSEFISDQLKVANNSYHKRFLIDFKRMADESSSSGKKVQLYPEKSPLISAFWRDKYEKEARKYWDIFYKRNANRFFKDRHYLDKEWGEYFQGMDFDAEHSVGEGVGDCSRNRRAILEVGCGTGNTVYPLIARYPQSYVYACDFSPRAVDLIKAHEDYDDSRVKAFVCDVTSDSLSEVIPPASVDIITLVFFLSAIAPEKMAAVVRNLRSVLKPGGYILLRDYAVGDLAQERFMIKDQQISENFYVRGDGTRAFYFSEDTLKSLFVEEGFNCKEIKVHCRQLENRSRKIVMDRRWIQSVFWLPEHGCIPSTRNLHNVTCTEIHISNKLISQEPPEPRCVDENVIADGQEDLIVDLSEGCAAELFGGAPPPELLEVAVGKYTVRANCLPKENQHTFPATGFMLWDSASALAELLEANPSVTREKTVLELGCGSVGLCSLMASLTAKKVVATDGDVGTLSLLQGNLLLNKEITTLDRISCHKLQWGSMQDIEALTAASGVSNFHLIIGTDLTYVQEAVPLLFETAKTLLMNPAAGAPEPLLILCHRIRRVAECDIISSAIAHGFHVAGLWTSDVSSKSYNMGSSKRSYIEFLFKQGLEKLSRSYNCIQVLCLSYTAIK